MSDSELSDSLLSESSTIISMSEFGDDLQPFTRKSSRNATWYEGLHQRRAKEIMSPLKPANSANDEDQSVHVTSA